MRLIELLVVVPPRGTHDTQGDAEDRRELVPRAPRVIEYASDRLPTVALTNAMLFTRRRRALASGRRRPRLCPDFLVARGEVSLADAKRLVIERFLGLRLADRSLPDAFRCAV